MISHHNAGWRNKLSALLPENTKNFLANHVLFGPLSGRLLRMVGPPRNVSGLSFDLASNAIPDEEVAAIYFNRRERIELDFVRRYVVPLGVQEVIELGTSIGFIASNILHRRQVTYFGIEASPRLAETAKENLTRNNRFDSKWQIANRCIDYGDRKTITFVERRSSLSGSKSEEEEGNIEVQTARFGDLVRQQGFKNYALISDIEGAEADIFFNDGDVLQHCQAIVAELEPTPRYSLDDQINCLIDLGFVMDARFGNVFAFGRAVPH